MSPFTGNRASRSGGFSVSGGIVKKFLSRALAWFTSGRRVALYAVALAILPILTRTGILTEDAGAAWLVIVQASMQVLAGLLMRANLSFAAAATWFARGGRAAIYSLGGFVAPALTTLGLFTPAQAEFWLKLLSDLLAVAAALLAALYITPTAQPAGR